MTEGRCVIRRFFLIHSVGFCHFVCTYIANQTGSPKNQWIPKRKRYQKQNNKLYEHKYWIWSQDPMIHTKCSKPSPVRYLYTLLQPKCVCSFFSFFRTLGSLFLSILQIKWIDCLLLTFARCCPCIQLSRRINRCFSNAFRSYRRLFIWLYDKEIDSTDTNLIGFCVYEFTPRTQSHINLQMTVLAPH